MRKQISALALAITSFSSTASIQNSPEIESLAYALHISGVQEIKSDGTLQVNQYDLPNVTQVARDAGFVVELNGFDANGVVIQLVEPNKDLGRLTVGDIDLGIHAVTAPATLCW
ncbi:hypothetical protein VIBNISFn27_870050 [Vibrio nigripulchritudo SFn27]|uniref:Uncharacterized protein n=1 Tax=Vibrio nigripulchritudo TaxID=28173 RepID=U4K9K4_9VIBR|nr:hypothetical protein [Vibrio nigripulchritudo]CCN85666.1 hypothetical protein VIBNIBLFn1_960050 [Vibrio nigripulchritudo BLFn1]CCN91078.1 hypothetical protein VIBNISFn27_870050 [Vibrio nigripulchritudo SFn27]CCN93548.1 hypothetical protein VIBNIENn2_240020 [Vibrio nigripulchritudo ENn2]CCO40085.1 hypothetical protein VIBNISFn135_220051 [Vibrio nigripulchritudo SFn135]CCO54157.1 hypothetical protein VIBNIWn13_640050 [Vibrio nigripulchritudo Wn13]